MRLFGFPMVLDWMHWEGTEREGAKQRMLPHSLAITQVLLPPSLTWLLQTAELLDGIIAVLGTPREDADHLKFVIRSNS